MVTANRPGAQTKEKLRVSGMDCGDCAVSIEKSLLQMPGVTRADVSFGTATADVSYDPEIADRKQIVRRISDLGYSVEEASQAVPLEFLIEGMDCGDCAQTIEKAVQSMPGVKSASVSFGSARLSIVPGVAGVTVNTADVVKKVSEAGYRATRVGARAGASNIPFWRRERRVLTTLAGTATALMAFVLSLLGGPLVVVNALFAVTVVVGGLGFARAGLLAARSRRADMNLLMTVAVLGAAALGDWAEAATVVLLFAFGGTLQTYTLEKTRGAIQSLMELTPGTALVRRFGAEGTPPRDIRLPVEEVLPGETVLIGPGERIPLDGAVLQGISSVDQSSITGESVPVNVEAGSDVFAGTINGAGALQIRTSHAAGDTALSRIIHLVEEAQGTRAPAQQFIERFSAIYTPLVILGAALVALVPPLLLGQPFGDWFYRALVLLVVACPCALVISTPVSIVSAIGAASRRGVLFKGGASLEALGTISVMAFDKTGTLTIGRPKVVSVHALDGNPGKLLALAAAVEARSEHPLARAVLHAARETRQHMSLPEATEFTALPGMGARAKVDGAVIFVGNARLFREAAISLNGVTGLLEELQDTGKTVMVVGTESGALGVIALADSPRPGASGSIRSLRQAGVRHIAMLTGDNARTATAIAGQVGVDSFEAELLPSEKLDAIKRLTARYGPVAMVGDGVNDAPALAAARVGIAMGLAGTDAALEVADVALMSDDLSRLDYAVLLSRKALGIIKANITISLVTKAAALALASVGLLPLWGAILADMGVSLLVTLNGMRLLGGRDLSGS